MSARNDWGWVYRDADSEAVKIWRSGPEDLGGPEDELGVFLRDALFDIHKDTPEGREEARRGLEYLKERIDAAIDWLAERD